MKGTIFLMVVILLSKLLGFIYRIQFMRIAGEEAVGIYMTAYPAFIFFISIVQLGIPIAVSKLIAQYFARQQYEHMQGVLKKALQLSFFSTLLFIPLLALLIPSIAQTFFHNHAILAPMYVGLAIVPIVVFASIFRAYLQGLTQIAPTAWAQLLEQLARITLTMTALPLMIQNQSPSVIAGYAMVITLAGECVSFVIIFIPYYIKKKKLQTKVSTKNMTKPILNLAIPSAGSKLFGTFTWFLEPIIFLKALAMSGVTAASAMTLYGIISGVHIPLLLFPSFVPNALAIVLIPAVSEAIARGHHHKMQQRIGVSLRLCAIVGCLASTFLFIHGDELTMSLFHLQENNGYMKLLAPIFFFYYIQSPLHSILQAFDEAKQAMMNSIYGGLGKLLLLFFLASQPFIQEKGAILAIGFGVLITSFLHIAAIRQHPKLNIGFRIFILPYTVFIIVAVLQSSVTLHVGLYTEYAITIFSTLLFLIIFKQIQLADLRYIRGLFRRF